MHGEDDSRLRLVKSNVDTESMIGYLLKNPQNLIAFFVNLVMQRVEVLLLFIGSIGR